MDVNSTNYPKIFDCHLHVDDNFEEYPLALNGGNVIFNSIDSYQKKAAKYPQFNQTLIFDRTQPVAFYTQLISEKRIVALKIHSRLQQICVDDYPAIIDALKQIDETTPIIYDAFYYGSDLDFQPSLKGLISLINAFPQRKFIVAHAGGYEVLKYFFHLRKYDQVGYDLSFSLQYLADTSCRNDLIKLMKYTPNERLFFGSDYPGGNPKIQLDNFNELAAVLQFTEEEIRGVLNQNWEQFLGITQR